MHINQQKRLIVTGGHLSPALSVMDELKKRGWLVVYLGRNFALERDTALSPEANEVRDHGHIFKPLISGRLQRYITFQSIISLIKLPIGFFQSFYYITYFHPQVILSFGGYLAVPPAIVGWLLRIPIVTHEQTRLVGLANKIIATFSRKICVGWPETKAYFPAQKVIYTGNPLRKEIFSVIDTITIPTDKPVLYVTGGNLGAHTINLKITEILKNLLEKFTLIHQCGNAQKYQDFLRLSEIKADLPSRLKDHYFLFTYISSRLIGWVFKKTDIMVSRAGANTVNEVIVLSKPTLFIPLPWAGQNEQEKNAQYLVEQKAALLLTQTELTGKRLLHEIDHLWQMKSEVTRNLVKIKPQDPNEAAVQVADMVESVV